MQLANAFPKNPVPLFPAARFDLNEFPSSVILPLTLFNGSDCWLLNFSLISFNNQIILFKMIIILMNNVRTYFD